eukprot:c39209_g1_i1.p1 GENE.c39209_g1_i1~~c39209_g1_i1.p1  ORF type:complete len:436 (+),score=38.00 c39209_g1_i1:30-1337(+)
MGLVWVLLGVCAALPLSKTGYSYDSAESGPDLHIDIQPQLDRLEKLATGLPDLRSLLTQGYEPAPTSSKHSTQRSILNGDENTHERVLGSRPAVPGGVPNPLKMFSDGIHKMMAALGQEGFGPLDQKMKQILSQSVGYVPGTYGYDSTGAGVMQNRRTQGETSSETNLCYALLETWMRSCSAPQLFFLETSVWTQDIHSPTGEAELDNTPDPQMAELMHDVDVIDQNDLTSDLPSADAQSGFWSLWDGPGAKEADPEEQARREAELERLKTSGQAHIDHDKLLATLMSHGLDENGQHLKAGTSPLAPAYSGVGRPNTPASPAAPAPPIFDALAGMFGTISQVVGGVTKVSNTSARIVGALDRATGGDGIRQLVGLVLGLFSAFMNMGIAKGQRPGFAAPEAYDPHGPYGPDPFPFQTPGSEKCHRFLTSWLAKCS